MSQSYIDTPEYEERRKSAARDVAHELLDALKAIAKRIDAGFGTAKWSAQEHDELVALIAKAERRKAA